MNYQVSMKMWFGNTTDVFELLNEDVFFSNNVVNNSTCARGYWYPSYSNWGLPANLDWTALT